MKIATWEQTGNTFFKIFKRKHHILLNDLHYVILTQKIHGYKTK